MKRACEHCGINFSPLSPQERYCCGGCSAVADLLAREGLEEFYGRRDAPGRPVGDLPQVDQAWAVAIQTEAEALAQNGEAVSLKLRLEGMTCGGCVWLIEHLFNREGSGDQIKVSLSRSSMVLEWKKNQGFSVASLLGALAAHGYRAKADGFNPLAALPASIHYAGLAVLFSLNAGLLFWLKFSEKWSAFAGLPVIWLINSLLLLSLLAGGCFWFLLFLSWRATVQEKAGHPRV
jgi:Cu2+-exporting ATPase